MSKQFHTEKALLEAVEKLFNSSEGETTLLNTRVVATKDSIPSDTSALVREENNLILTKGTSLWSVPTTKNTSSSLFYSVTATSSSSGQSMPVCSKASIVRIRNTDASNYGVIGLGTSTCEAELNCTNGENSITKFLLPPASSIDVSGAYGFVAWMAVSTSITITLMQA